MSKFFIERPILANVIAIITILLVGMMTEAVVTPWLSDRDIALQNVRYVLNATGDMHEDFRPAPDGFVATDVRESALAVGMVDYKICAVDNDWTGMKFARRKK